MFRALACNPDGGIIHDSTHESTGDACQELVDKYHLSEAEHQVLWDNLFYQTEHFTLSVEHSLLE